MRSALIGSILATLLINSSLAAELESKSGDQFDPPQAAESIAAVVNLVLEQHVAAPTGQQMVLDLLRNLHSSTSEPLPDDLAQRISAVPLENLKQFLSDYLTDLSRNSSNLDSSNVRESLTNMLAALPGHAFLTSTKNFKVAEQIASNRYVGIGIALAMSAEKVPNIRHLMPDGPLERAGGLLDDVIEAVDGESTKGKKLEQVVEMLRGPQGSEITLVLRNPKDEISRTLTFHRDVVHIPSLRDLEMFQVDAESLFGYLKVQRISAAVVHELRGIDTKLREQNARGLILDLRNLHGTDLHHAVMLADALLDGGEIGGAKNRQGTKKYNASRDALFRDLQLAVIVNQNTSGTVEWLAAALQDNKRAVIVGDHTAGQGFANTAVPIPNSQEVVSLPNLILTRQDGANLVDERLFMPQRRAPSVTRLRRAVENPLRRSPAKHKTGPVIPKFLIEEQNQEKWKDQAIGILRKHLKDSAEAQLN